MKKSKKSGKTVGVKVEKSRSCGLAICLEEKIRENERSQNSSQSCGLDFERKKYGKTKGESNFD